jgi:hypothetical protein
MHEHVVVNQDALDQLPKAVADKEAALCGLLHGIERKPVSTAQPIYDDHAGGPAFHFQIQ